MNKLSLSAKTRQRVFSLFFSLHFLVIFCVCVYSSIDSYISFYDIEKKGLQKGAMDATATVFTAPVLKQYATVAGIDAGYGFFAPNVASEYVLEYRHFDEQGMMVGRQRLPAFEQKESYMRYSTMLGGFQEKFIALDDTAKSSTLKIRFLNVLIKSMGKNMLAENPVIHTVTATLYLYDYPSLQGYAAGHTTSQLIPFDNFKITR